MLYSINNRPTLELFFSTEQGHTFCVTMDGLLPEILDEDLLQFRSEPLDSTNVNDDVREAIKMAKAHATANGWTLDEAIYFN